LKLQAYETGYVTEKFAPESVVIAPGADRQIDQPLIVQSRLSPFVSAIRRTLDFSLSLILLVVLLPVFLALAILVKTDSKGPILFKQYRVGQNGTQFWFYKFRSMVIDAEARRAALEAMNEASGPLFKMKNDPRITRCGRWMRKYSIDELPQLINVLKGDMSLVGPRPALPAEVAQYNDFQKARLAVQPGITGLWQVSGRSDLSFDQSVQLDIDYIQQQTLWLDFTILLRTFGAVVKGRGAY
jgi:exopolysaccharide biosynthesis polyprenyl glycosylphosphotransferase